MKKILLILAIIFLGYSSVVAQGDFKRGYLIQNNDTISGLIDQQSEKKNSARVSFRKTDKAAIQLYSPKEVSGYGYENGPVFETKQLGLGDTATIHFFKILVKGTASLYTFRDSLANDHFYLEKDKLLQELVYFELARERNGKHFVLPVHLYRGTLQETLSDCPDLLNIIQKTDFSQPSLKKVIVRYNQCQPSTEPQFVENTSKTEVTWGIVAGGIVSVLDINGSEMPLEQAQRYTAIDPTGGIFVQSALPWLGHRLAIQAELLYKHSKFNQTFPNRTQSNEVLLDFHDVKVPIMIRYHFPLPKRKPFLNAGLTSSYTIKQQQEIITTDYSVDPEGNVTKRPYAPATRRFMTSYFIGAGIQVPAWNHHLFTLEGRWERGNGFANYTRWGTFVNQYSMQLSFSL